MKCLNEIIVMLKKLDEPKLKCVYLFIKELID